MKRIYFIRHGETLANIEKRYSSTGGSPLTEKGISQAAKVVKDMSGLNLGMIYSSPLDRCISLAQDLSKEMNLEPIVDERIREYQFGVLDNLTWKEAERKQPDEFRQFCENPATYKIPEGESLSEFNSRVAGFVDEMLSKDGDAAVVTHAGVIRSALAELLCLDEIQRWIFKIRNGSVTLVEIDNDIPALVLREGL